MVNRLISEKQGQSISGEKCPSDRIYSFINKQIHLYIQLTFTNKTDTKLYFLKQFNNHYNGGTGTE